MNIHSIKISDALVKLSAKGFVKTKNSYFVVYVLVSSSPIIKKHAHPMQISVIAIICFDFNFSLRKNTERVVLKRIVILLVLASST